VNLPEQGGDYPGGEASYTLNPGQLSCNTVKSLLLTRHPTTFGIMLRKLRNFLYKYERLCHNKQDEDRISFRNMSKIRYAGNKKDMNYAKSQ
jgi:hypothetical protein